MRSAHPDAIKARRIIGPDELSVAEERPRLGQEQQIFHASLDDGLRPRSMPDAKEAVATLCGVERGVALHQPLVERAGGARSEAGGFVNVGQVVQLASGMGVRNDSRKES